MIRVKEIIIFGKNFGTDKRKLDGIDNRIELDRPLGKFLMSDWIDMFRLLETMNKTTGFTLMDGSMSDLERSFIQVTYRPDTKEVRFTMKMSYIYISREYEIPYGFQGLFEYNMGIFPQLITRYGGIIIGTGDDWIDDNIDPWV